MLKRIEKVSPQTKTVSSDLYNIFGDKMEFYQVLPLSDVNSSNYSATHLWTGLGRFNETNYNLDNTSIVNGGLLDSAFASIPEAFWQNGMIVISFNSDTYREKINCYNFGITIPLNTGYTGLTSGLTATTLYTSFIWEPGCLNTNPNSLCAGTILDSRDVEGNKQFTSNIGLGWNYINGINPVLPTDSFDSGIAYLVTDSIPPTTISGATGSSVSWSFGFGQSNKFANGARTINPTLAQTNNSYTYDTVVGMVNRTAGLVYIWNPDLVNAWDWTGFAGNPLTGTTTTSGNTYAVVGDKDTQVSVSIEIISEPGAWTNTTNPSIIGENCGTVVTDICLFNEKGDLLGVATANEAIPIDPNNYTILKLDAPISGTINETGIWSQGVTLPLY